MDKSNKLKEMTIGIILVTLLISSVSVFASGAIKKQLEVVYNDIKLVVDGKPVEFGKDSAGNKIEPFIYNGTTYLPVRAVGEAIDKKVDWDGSTQTVYLGKKPGEISYMTEEIEPYKNYSTKIYNLNDPTTLKMSGKEYKTGYKLGGYSSAYIMFNLNGQYSEIKGMIGATNWGYILSRTFDIYLDGDLYKTITVEPEKLPEEIIIPVKGVMQVKFESPYKSNGNTYVGFGDVIIK